MVASYEFVTFLTIVGQGPAVIAVGAGWELTRLFHLPFCISLFGRPFNTDNI